MKSRMIQNRKVSWLDSESELSSKYQMRSPFYVLYQSTDASHSRLRWIHPPQRSLRMWLQRFWHCSSPGNVYQPKLIVRSADFINRCVAGDLSRFRGLSYSSLFYILDQLTYWLLRPWYPVEDSETLHCPPHRLGNWLKRSDQMPDSELPCIQRASDDCFESGVCRSDKGIRG